MRATVTFLKAFYSVDALCSAATVLLQIILVIGVPMVTALAISVPVMMWVHGGFGLLIFFVLFIVGLIKASYAADKTW